MMHRHLYVTSLSSALLWFTEKKQRDKNYTHHGPHAKFEWAMLHFVAVYELWSYWYCVIGSAANGLSFLLR